MLRKLLILLVALAGMSGCATSYDLFNPSRPGTMPWAGGEVQLMFSNPDYGPNGFTSQDQLTVEDTRQSQAFGANAGYPVVTGGIGLMGTWPF